MCTHLNRRSLPFAATFAHPRAKRAERNAKNTMKNQRVSTTRLLYNGRPFNIWSFRNWDAGDNNANRAGGFLNATTLISIRRYEPRASRTQLTLIPIGFAPWKPIRNSARAKIRVRAARRFFRTILAQRTLRNSDFPEHLVVRKDLRCTLRRIVLPRRGFAKTRAVVNVKGVRYFDDFFYKRNETTTTNVHNRAIATRVSLTHVSTRRKLRAKVASLNYSKGLYRSISRNSSSFLFLSKYSILRENSLDNSTRRALEVSELLSGRKFRVQRLCLLDIHAKIVKRKRGLPKPLVTIKSFRRNLLRMYPPHRFAS